ncbi:MAG: FeoB-associated Cys-rich membrane protein [Lautropia sp.]|nr:FeoB-associated Cys-rich membrane protein [Lautropia sp.]
MLDNIIVGAIVVVAAVYILRKFFFTGKNSGDTGCGRCGGCSGSKSGGGCH